MGHIEFNGQWVEIHKKLRGTTTVLLPHITSVTIENAGIGMRAIRVAVGGGSEARPQLGIGSASAAAEDPYTLTFRKKHLPEFEAFRTHLLEAVLAR